MQINKQDEKLFQELLKKYKQGLISGLIQGNNVTLTSTGCRNKVISSIGEGGSIYIAKTYAELRTLITASQLVKGASYLLTDFATIYDQSISDITKTSSIERLVLIANSNNTFNPIVSSLDFTTDIIHYDITVDSTYINNEPCKGKITYREDINGNKAPFDFRKVLMFNSNTNAEDLVFDLSTTNSTEFLGNDKLTKNLANLEFPASYIVGESFFNSANAFINSYILGGLVQNTGNILFGSTVNGSFNQNSNNNISGSIIEGSFAQNANIEITDCTIVGDVDFATSSTWNNTTFGENVTKCVEVNFNNSSVGNRIDRLINCTILTSNVGGRLYWCQNLAIFNSDIVGGFQGVNNITWENTDANCEVEDINGVTNYSTKFGFKDCTITGTTSSDYFSNITINCLVDSKTIDQSIYPELFDRTYHKTIYKKPNGDTFYRYLDNSNVWVYTQII